MSKFCPSTRRWAFSIERLTSGLSIGTSSSMPRRSIHTESLSPEKMRMRSSSRDM
jgi:hypothetical protein